MNRSLLVTLCAGLSCLLGGIASVRAAEPPNIVMILGDDQAWTDYGFMGHPEIKTPHLDRLATHISTRSAATTRRREPIAARCFVM